MLSRTAGRERRTRSRGFTLLELIVVLAVLGILALIAVPRFTTVQSNSAATALGTTAQGIVRNANAIAASNPAAGGRTTGLTTWTSVFEAYPLALAAPPATTVNRDLIAGGTTRATMTYAGTGTYGEAYSLVLTQNQGNLVCTVTIAGTGSALAAVSVPAACV
jgi:prepilin-type N-terminal cleavage/methylation domain-containing protein